MTCKICRTPVTHRRLDKQQLRYYFCPTCDYIFKDPSAYLSAAEQKARYLAHNNDPTEPGYCRFLKTFIARALQPYQPPPARVLDFGSGPAPALAAHLIRCGYQVEIYDPYFAPTPPSSSTCFDAITLLEVAEHLPDPALTFRELSLKLVPGGILALQTLFYPGDPEKFDSWWYRRDSTHIGFFSPSTLHHLALACGLTILHEDGKSICTLQKN